MVNNEYPEKKNVYKMGCDTTIKCVKNGDFECGCGCNCKVWTMLYLQFKY